jgi:hypothetical protein
VRVVAEAAKPSAAIPPARKFRRALFGKSFARSNDGAQQAHARKSLFDIGFCNIDRAGVSAFIPIPVFFVSLARHKFSHAGTLGKHASIFAPIASAKYRDRWNVTKP